MALAKDYASVMSRKGEIMKKALGMDFSAFESGSIAFDYEKMMSSTGFSMEEVERVQGLTGVGNTPLFTLRNLTALARKCARPGYGATICVKDEMTNPSGSFKARRAACAVAFAKAHGYKGVIAATSGNYGAAVAPRPRYRASSASSSRKPTTPGRWASPRSLRGPGLRGMGARWCRSPWAPSSSMSPSPCWRTPASSMLPSIPPLASRHRNTGP